jgi:hypothetical protein
MANCPPHTYIPHEQYPINQNPRRIAPAAKQLTHNKLSLVKRQYREAKSREKADERK